MVEEKESIAGLPDVDLTGVVNDLEKTQKETQVSQPQIPDIESDKLWTETFKKNPQNILKSYRELQAAFTKTVQEKKAFEEQAMRTKELEEQLEIEKMKVNIPQQSFVPQNFTEDLSNNPELAIEKKVESAVATREIINVLQEEDQKNHTEFQERYAFAQMAKQRYPHLAMTGSGVRKLFEIGDKLREEQLKKNAAKAMEAIFGGPLNEEEISRLVTLVKGKSTIPSQKQTQNLNAYMPETSTTTKIGSESELKQNIDLEIKKSVQEGDVDGAIAAVFKRQLAG